jgi:hypothetical protein
MFLYNMKRTKSKKSKTPYYTLGLLSMLTALYNMETSPDVTDPYVNDPDLTALGGRRKSRKRHTHTR